MGFVGATLSGLSKPFTWNGRASRSEYWWFHLANLLFMAGGTWLILMPAFQPMLGALLAEDAPLALALVPSFWEPAMVLYWVASIWIYFSQWSLLVRRLHDINLSGWWQLVAIVPILGPLALLVMMFIPSFGSANRWGPPPGGSAEPEAGSERRSAWTSVPETGKAKRTPLSSEELRAMRHARMPGASTA